MVLLSGARAYYAMAKDKLFFPACGLGRSIAATCLGIRFGCSAAGRRCWCCLALTIRLPGHTAIYSAICSTTLFRRALFFYILTIAGVIIIRLRQYGGLMWIGRTGLSATRLCRCFLSGGAAAIISDGSVYLSSGGHVSWNRDCRDRTAGLFRIPQVALSGEPARTESSPAGPR